MTSLDRTFRALLPLLLFVAGVLAPGGEAMYAMPLVVQCVGSEA